MSKEQDALKLALEALNILLTEPIAHKAADKAEYLLLQAAPAIRSALTEQPAQQQEPVAWMYQCSADSSGPVFMQHKRDWAESGSGLWTEKPLYTSPPASKPWVGLTRDERMDIINRFAGQDWVYAVEAIEAKLREKNA